MKWNWLLRKLLEDLKASELDLLWIIKIIIITLNTN